MLCITRNNSSFSSARQARAATVSIWSQVVICSTPKGRFVVSELCGTALARREHNDRHSSAIGRFGAPAGKADVVRFCAELYVCYECRESNRGDDADAGQAAFRRAKPAGGGDHSRRNRAPPHLPAIAGRAGQAQPFDTGESARRTPSIHPGDHRAAGAGARRLLAQGPGRAGGPGQRRRSTR